MTTKNEYKAYLENLTEDKIKIEEQNLRLEIMKAKGLSKKGLNPYEKGKTNVKNTHWKLKQVMTTKWKINKIKK